MSDLLSKLKAGRAATKTFPLGEVRLGLRLLVESDYQQAGWAANDMLAEHEAELSPANADLFESEKATQLILRFVVDPATGKSVFPTADEVRDTLSREERNAIVDAYYDFEREHSPSERTMSEADFARLLEDVKKKPDPHVLKDLSGALLKRLVLSLVSPPTS
jgi:uncharacterized alpha-E superfamily protein